VLQATVVADSSAEVEDGGHVRADGAIEVRQANVACDRLLRPGSAAWL
jgi:hypothetical protein